MTPELKAAIGRLRAIRADGKEVVGSAFVVGKRHLLTAFHVVGDRAASTAKGSRTLYRELWFEPMGLEAERVSVKLVEDASDAVADWALLEAGGDFSGIRPLPLGEVAEREIEDGKLLFETWGFPTLARLTGSGVAISGRVQDRDARYQDAWTYQLFSENAAAALGDPLNGLSGAPCLVDGAVVGIIRSNLIAQARTGAVEAPHIAGGILYACPLATTTLQERCATYGLALDPIRGLPGLPRQKLPVEPFRYLHWYGTEHAEVFFGRNRKVHSLYFQVTDENTPAVTLFYGASGIGKSSLLEAGLLPRLLLYHEVGVSRREASRRLIDTFSDSLDVAVTASQKTGRPAVVVLDQIEEVFADPKVDGKAELVSLAQRIKGELAQRNDHLLKIILSFRSEWLANVRTRLTDEGLAVGEFYLERLARDEIEEIVRGISSTERLRKFYQFVVDKDLPRRVADDLLEDPSSPVSPVLSIILTRMWNEARGGRPGEWSLSVQTYEERMRSRLDLNRFLAEQLDAVAQTHPKDVASGLVTDVLYRHTTGYGTATELSGSEIENLYGKSVGGGQADHVRDVMRVLGANSLLYSIEDNDAVSPGERGGITRLAHDTLAPLVRANYDTSVKPGQRAERILQSRVQDWDPAHPESGLIDPVDLAVVDDGKSGMRAWTDREASLVSASIKRRNFDKAKRWIALGVSVGAAFAIVALIFVLIATQRETLAQQREADAGNLARTAERLVENGFSKDAIAKAVASMDKLEEGASLTNQAPTSRSLALANLKSRAVTIPAVVGVPGAVWFPDLDVIVGRPSKAHIRPNRKNNELLFLSSVSGEVVSSLKFGAALLGAAADLSRDELYVLERNGRVSRYDVRGRTKIGEFQLPESILNAERFDFVAARDLLLVLWKDRAIVYDPKTGALREVKSDLFADFKRDLIFEVDADELASLQSSSLGEDITARGTQILYDLHQTAADTFCDIAATGGFDGVLRIWSIRDGPTPKLSFAANVSDRIVSLKLSPRCDSLLIMKETSGYSLFDIANKRETQFWRDIAPSHGAGFDDTGNAILFIDDAKMTMFHVRSDASLGGSQWRSIADFRPVGDEILLRVAADGAGDRNATPIVGGYSTPKKRDDVLHLIGLDAKSGALKCDDTADMPSDLNQRRRSSGGGASTIVLIGGRACAHYLVGLNATLFDVIPHRENFRTRFEWVKVADLPEKYDTWPTTWSSVAMAVQDDLVLLPGDEYWRLFKRFNSDGSILWKQIEFRKIIPKGTGLGGSPDNLPAFSYIGREDNGNLILLGDSNTVWLVKVGSSEVVWERPATSGCASMVIKDANGNIFIQEFGDKSCAPTVYKLNIETRQTAVFAHGYLLRAYLGGEVFLVEDDENIQVVDSQGAKRCQIRAPKEGIVWDEVQPGQLDAINSSTVTEGSFLFSPHQSSNLARWHFITLGHDFIVGGHESKVLIWSSSSCKLLSEAEVERNNGQEQISDLVGLGGGDLFAIATAEGATISLWKASAGAEIVSIAARGTVRRLFTYRGAIFGTVGIREAVDIIRVDDFTTRTLKKDTAENYNELRAWLRQEQKLLPK